jgi:hypothetical protein
MATQTIQFRADAGLDLKARLYPVASDTAFAAEATCTEATNRKGLYSFTQSGSSGQYEVKVWDDTTETRYLLGTQFVETTDIAATFECVNQPAEFYLNSSLAAIKSDTGNLITRIPATLFSGITYLARWLGLLAGKTVDSTTLAEMTATTAGAGYVNTTDSLEALRDRGDSGAWGGSGGSGLTGANLVTITVTDGTDPVPGAYVRLKAGGDVEVKRTNGSGVVTFTTDNNTWTVTIDATNLTFESTTLAVTGDTEVTYEMDPVATSHVAFPYPDLKNWVQQ